MSNSSLPHQRTTQLQKTTIGAAGIVIVVLLIFLSLWTLMSLASRHSQKTRSLPAGQLQADASTLVAALSFLFDHDLDSGCSEAPTGSAALCAGNLGVQPLISGSFCGTSNQSELFTEPVTNVPARS